MTPLVETYVSRGRTPTAPVTAARVTADNLPELARWSGGVVQGATVAVPLRHDRFVPSAGQIARPGCVIARMSEGVYVVFSAAEWDNSMVLESVARARLDATSRRDET